MIIIIVIVIFLIIIIIFIIIINWVRHVCQTQVTWGWCVARSK
jgi:hypothetical protein